MSFARAHEANRRRRERDDEEMAAALLQLLRRIEAKQRGAWPAIPQQHKEAA